MSSILEIKNISKVYGPVHALNNVTFSVPQGSVFGILGPNGSGKTTLLGIVMDVLRASSGEFLWNGAPGSSDQRKKIGTLLETPNFYAYLSGRANLQIAAAIKERGENDIDRVLQMVNLHQRASSKFSTYSLGMKQRLAIASSLLGNPDILVFDEPTNGLDPAGIAEIRELIKQLNAQGKTIIMASHILDEVERVCTHVAIIQKGQLKTVGTVASVLSGTSSNLATTSAIQIDIAADNLEGLQAIISKMPGVLNTVTEGNTIQVTGDDTITARAINQYCFAQGIVLSLLSEKKKNLEARFLEITGTQSDR